MNFERKQRRASDFGGQVIETVLKEMLLKYEKLTRRDKIMICEAIELYGRLNIEVMHQIAVEDGLELANFSMLKHRISKKIEGL